jgi:lipooligosaccharide transport system permease protein
MVQRNLLVYKHTWMIVFSGFFEPLFYLLSIGLGLGAFVPDIDNVSYAAFVVPGLLAASCMNGAITDGMFNIFFRLHFQKTYDSILATPMRAPDVAFGEMLWALTRGSLYAVTFLIVVLVLGEALESPMLLSPWAMLAPFASVLISASFSAMTLCVTSFLRRIEDFDAVMGLGVFPMFLLGGTFFPVTQFPDSVRWLVQLVPLYHGAALLRQLTTGAVDSSILAHLVYLVLLGCTTFVIAMRRLEQALIK